MISVTDSGVPTIDYVRERLRRVQYLMRRDDLDVLLAYKVGSEAYAYGGQGYFRYLAPTIAPLPIPPGMVVILADEDRATAVLYRGLAAAETWKSDVLEIETCEMTSMERLRSQELVDGVASVIHSRGPNLRRIGMVLLEELPVWLLDSLRRKFADIEIIDATELLDELMMDKTEHEIEMVRRVAELAEDVIQVVFDGVAPGRTELEVVAEAKKIATIRGADYADIRLATSNPKRTGFGVGPSSRKQIQKQDHLHIGVDISSDGYWANVVRRGVLGQATDAYRQLCDLTRQMYENFLQEAHIGRPAGEVVRAIELRSREDIADMAVESFEFQRFGHGIGFENQEPPFLVAEESRPIAANMTFAIHPGLLVREIGQAAVGSIVLVTEGGARSLTTFAMGLVEV